MLVLSMKKRQNGFTLFEMLVVISIIGVLVAMISGSFSGAQKRARDAKRVSDINTLQKSAEQYYSLSSSVYPPVVALTTPWIATVGTTVLERFPGDPKTGTAYPYSVANASSTYCTCAALEVTSGNSSTSACAAPVAGVTPGYYCATQRQ